MQSGMSIVYSCHVLASNGLAQRARWVMWRVCLGTPVHYEQTVRYSCPCQHSGSPNRAKWSISSSSLVSYASSQQGN